MSARALYLGLLVMVSAACGRHENGEPKKNAAFHIGEAAHAVAKETGKVAAVAGKKLAEGAKDAHEGWKDAERKDRRK